MFLTFHSGPQSPHSDPPKDHVDEALGCRLRQDSQDGAEERNSGNCSRGEPEGGSPWWEILLISSNVQPQPNPTICDVYPN